MLCENGNLDFMDISLKHIKGNLYLKRIHFLKIINCILKLGQSSYNYLKN